MKELRLLLVEDSALDAETLLAVLRHEGWVVTFKRVWSESGLYAALSEAYDICFLDHKLPGLRVERALEVVRTHKPFLPIFIVSGMVDETEGARLMDKGAQDYVPKWNFARLVPALKRELVTSRLLQRIESCLA